MRITQLSRFRASLLALHAGDSYGAPYEYSWTPERIQADIERRGGLIAFDYPDPFDRSGQRILAAGRPTDDSEMAAILAASLLDRDGVDEKDQYRRYRNAVIAGESILWPGKAEGFGGTTRKVLSFDSWEQSLAAAVPLVASNGSLMRNAPIALYYHGQLSTLTIAAMRASIVTHRNPEAVECCIVHAHFLDELLSGRPPYEAWYALEPRLRHTINSSRINRLLATDPGKPTVESSGHRFSAFFTLQAAVWATINAKSVQDGILKVILLGGDTDTYAAVAGSLLGAHFGLEGIPPEWLTPLRGYDMMLFLADHLWEQLHEDRR